MVVWRQGAWRNRITARSRANTPTMVRESIMGNRDSFSREMAHFPEPLVVKLGFLRVIPGTEVVLEENASAVYGTENARDVTKTRLLRSGKVLDDW